MNLEEKNMSIGAITAVPFELLVLNKLARALNALILYLKLATIFVKCHHNQHHQKLTFTNHEKVHLALTQ